MLIDYLFEFGLTALAPFYMVWMTWKLSRRGDAAHEHAQQHPHSYMHTPAHEGVERGPACYQLGGRDRKAPRW